MLNARYDRVPAATRRQLESAVREFEAAVDLARDAAAGPDAGTENAHALQARDTAQALRRVLIEKQLVVTRALEQMAAGSYGFCEDCSRPIDAERLRVLPEATRCVDCQRRQ